MAKKQIYLTEDEKDIAAIKARAKEPTISFKKLLKKLATKSRHSHR